MTGLQGGQGLRDGRGTKWVQGRAVSGTQERVSPSGAVRDAGQETKHRLTLLLRNRSLSPQAHTTLLLLQSQHRGAGSSTEQRGMD